MRETTVLFGETKSVVGIVTDPAPDAPRRAQACLLLNSGYIHRVGPQRLYVKMARRLAAAGFVTLRFDYSGIGDSPTRPDNLQFNQASIREAKDAMDFLASSRGIEQFVASGICWGGDNALRVSYADERVVGAYPIDFYMLPSRRHMLRLYLPRLLSPRSWGNLVRGDSALLGMLKQGVRRALRRGNERQAAAAQAIMPAAAVDRVIEGLGVLVDRGVDLGFVLTRGGSSLDHYLKSFRGAMRALQQRGKGRLEVEIVEADHLFTLLSNQELLVGMFDRWMQAVAARRGGAAPAAPAIQAGIASASPG